MGKWRHIFALLMLSVLMASTAVSLHGYSHADNDIAGIEDCSWCQFAVNGQQDLYSVPEATSIQPIAEAPVYPAKIEYRSPVLSGDAHHYHLFSRPPPAVI